LQKINYPITKKVHQTDDFFGVNVSDPYRWLEENTSSEVKDWINAQNKITDDYLDKIPFRNKIKEKIKSIVNVPRYTIPVKAGEYFFYSKNDGLQPQSIIYRQKDIDGEPEIFLDPNLLSEDCTTSVLISSPSKDNKYISFIIQEAGSDWTDIAIYQVESGNKLPDKIDRVKFGDVSWKGDGFFYSRFPASDSNSLSDINENQMIFYHKLGTDTNEDKLIFENKLFPQSFNHAYVTEDEKYLLIYSYKGNENTDVYLSVLNSDSDFINPKLFIKGKDNVSDYAIYSENEGIFFVTNRNTPNRKLVLIDTKNPDEKNWRIIIPEKAESLETVSIAGNKIIATYIKDVISKVYQFDINGNFEHEIILPALGTTYGFSGKKNDDFTFYMFNSFLYPASIFIYNFITGESKLFKKYEANINLNEYEMKQIFYKSKDGTSVPMFIINKKGIELNGKNPTLLNGYGGFSICNSPDFDPNIFPILDQGGVFASANIRGGGEYGEKWNEAGRIHNTQNRFDDFIAAAEYLLKENYTSRDYLSIMGRSHGGCLIGSVMLQRPELFKVAFPVVGVLDMLRFHKFTVGWNWQKEYGSPDNPEHFKILYGYSPVHNVKMNINYPATLVITADHDDRVVPMHSYKFISELQSKNTGMVPLLLKTDVNSGHGSSSLLKRIDDFTDMISFMLYNMNVNYK